MYHMCKTWLQKVHGGWETGAGVILNKKHKLKYIGFDLFYFMSETSEIHCMNVMD